MIERLNRVLEHLEERLSADVDVEALARIALTSPYHLRRVFSTLAGMPLSTYVRRRRMTLAAADVVGAMPRCSRSRSGTATARPRRSPVPSATCTA